MLDVHPPHEATHSWKDFFLHIATIVVGLLIAVGLEQSVEAIHRHSEVAEAREALASERELNRKLVADDVLRFRREAAALENNLIVLDALEQHPGIARADLPGILTWHSDLQGQRAHAAWDTAQQTGVTNLMPAAEVRDDARLYGYLTLLVTTADEEWTALGEARTFTVGQPDPTRWTPAQVEQAIERTEMTLVRLQNFGAALVYLHQDIPEFAPGFSNLDLKPLMRVDASELDPATAAARAKTVQRIDAAGKFPDYFPQADGTQK